MSYDVLLLMQELNSIPSSANLAGLPKNQEKLRTLTIGNFVIKDSLHHLQSGLGKLCDTLADSSHNYEILRQSSLCNTIQDVMNDNGDVVGKARIFHEEKFQLLLKKGHFPFALATSASDLLEIKSFPPIESFYDYISKTISVTQEEWNFAKSVFEKFECESMLHYCLLYCHTDAILLAECLFR